jgi:nucleotide-binding universal stress UspA family protein
MMVATVFAPIPAAGGRRIARQRSKVPVMTVLRRCPARAGPAYGPDMHSEVSVPRELPVMVGVDGSRSHLSTVDLGVAAAVRHGRPLLIVHVWPGRYLGSLRPRTPMPTEADGRHLLEIAARRAEHIAPGLRVATELVNGSASAVLTRLSGEARLLVIGHRDDAANRQSWGSTAAYLAHHSACPLLVHRGGTCERGPVVLAASARWAGTATVACAYEEAALAGSRLVAAHVWTPPAAQDSVSAGRGSLLAEARADADRLLAGALADWAGLYPEVTVERLLVSDVDIAYTVDRASRRGRLLVAGIGLMGRLAELLYGSPGSTLSPRAACPVLLVPPGWHPPTTAKRQPDVTMTLADGAWSPR